MLARGMDPYAVYSPNRQTLLGSVAEGVRMLAPPEEVLVRQAELDKRLGLDREATRHWIKEMGPYFIGAGITKAVKPISPTQGMVNMRIANMAKGNEERAFAQQHGIPESMANRLFERHAETGILPPSSGGRTPLPGGVPQGVPQPLLPYPKTAPGQLKTDPVTGRQWLGKAHSPEELAVKKMVTAAQKDIKAGNYKPYFDVSKRADVDFSKYKSGPTTIAEASPKTAKSKAKYDALANAPETRKRLREAFKKGLKIKNTENWFFMAQLEREFIKEFGPVAGRDAFKAKFADPMAATTGGADPMSNFRMAMYGNYLKANNLPFPSHGYQMPYPIGGQYVGGNIQQYANLPPGGYTTANPKRYNFSRNFLGDEMSMTLDEQMSGLLQPGMKMPPAGSYGAWEAGAAKVAKQQKVDPRMFEEVAWAGKKGMKEGKPMIQDVNESIERTSRMTGLTPKEVVKWGIIHSRIPMYGFMGAAGLEAVAGAE